jgi:hypothetical protein
MLKDMSISWSEAAGCLIATAALVVLMFVLAS